MDLDLDLDLDLDRVLDPDPTDRWAIATDTADPLAGRRGQGLERAQECGQE